jgi:hypothetical protein
MRNGAAEENYYYESQHPLKKFHPAAILGTQARTGQSTKVLASTNAPIQIVFAKT